MTNGQKWFLIIIAGILSIMITTAIIASFAPNPTADERRMQEYYVCVRTKAINGFPVGDCNDIK